MRFVWQDWAVFLIVPAVAWFLGYRARRKAGAVQGWRGYFLAQGQLSTGSVTATYIGANLTFTSIFLILSQESFRRGWLVLFVPGSWLLGTLVFLLLQERIKPHIQAGRTLHQTLGHVFQSPQVQKWASFWTILAFVGTVALEFYGGIRLISWAGQTLLTSYATAFLLALVVTAFTAQGGLRGVAWADVFLDLATLCTLIMVGLGVYKAFDTPSPVVTSGSTEYGFDPLFAISMLILFVPFQLCTLDSWQRLLAWSKSHSSPRNWLIAGSILLAIAYCVPIAAGIATNKLGFVGTPENHPFAAFLTYLRLPAFLLGLCFAGLAGAMLSTADELLNCTALSLLFDLRGLGRSSNGNTDSATQARLVASGRFYTAVFGFASAGIAVLMYGVSTRLADLALAVFSAQVVFVWPLLAALFTPRLAPGLRNIAIATMLFSYLAAISLVVLGAYTDQRDLVDGAPIGAFVLATAIFVPAWVWKVRRSPQP